MADVLILCYHALSPSWEAGLSITPDAFEQQITHLLKRGWQPVTFADAALNPTARRTLAITFDDAFLSVKEYALPILSTLGAPATVFAPSAYMDGGQSLGWAGVSHWAETENAQELRAMDWADLRELSDQGWEIGSHTRRHPRLTQLDDATLDEELQVSRAEVAERLGRPCQTLAYPYGDVNARVVSRAQVAGYTAAAALDSHLQPLGQHLVPRVGIYHRDSWPRFLLKALRPTRELRATRLWSEAIRVRSLRQR